MSITIDALLSTEAPTLGHVFPTMKDGRTEHLSVQQIANLIIASITDSAPTTLDTLNELAVALDNDPNFAATIAAALAEKADQAFVLDEFNARLWQKTGIVNNSTTIDITEIPSNFTRLEIQLKNIASASDAVDLHARIDSGSGFINTSGAYSWFQRYASTAVAFNEISAASDTKMIIANGFGTAIDETGNLIFNVLQASNNNIPGFMWVGEISDALPAYRRVEGNGRRLATGRVQGIQFFMSSGNMSCEYSAIAHLE